MKKTVYTCDFCVQPKHKDDIKTVNGYDICDSCNNSILWHIFENPLLFPNLKLTPFCKKCNGTKKLFERNFNGVETCEEQLACDACTII